MEEKTTDNRNTFAIKTFLKDYLDLRKDKDNELETVDSIRKEWNSKEPIFGF